MGEQIHALAQALPGKASLEECTLEELQQLARQYPYFAPAQFLLLQKLKAEGSPDYPAQLQKAVLYYHDPLEFNAIVSSDRFFMDKSIFSGREISKFGETVNQDAGSKVPVGLTESEEEISTKKEKPARHNAIIITNDETTSDFVEQAITDDNESKEQEKASDPIETRAEEWTPSLNANKQSEETLVNEQAPIEQSASNEEVSSLGEKDELERKEHVSGATTLDAGNAAHIHSHKKITEETNTKEATLLFEPYHTVDYFASQGIKVSAEELPKDKLGKQLRSFTEWLKTMKRLPATEMAKTPESTAEKSVENMASHSVEESDVVTEAMAEVWAKQGAREKAVETYNKLSLLNPSKRAYFAAKIENLKQP